MSAAGTMTQGWTVWCDTCAKWDQVSGTKATAAREFRASGWKKKGGKWECRDCQPRLEPSCAAEWKNGQVVPK